MNNAKETAWKKDRKQFAKKTTVSIQPFVRMFQKDEKGTILVQLTPPSSFDNDSMNQSTDHKESITPYENAQQEDFSTN